MRYYDILLPTIFLQVFWFKRLFADLKAERENIKQFKKPQLVLYKLEF